MKTLLSNQRLLSLFSLLICILVISNSQAQAEISDKQFQELMAKYLSSESGKESVGQAVETYFTQRQQQARRKQEEQQAQEMEDQFKNPVKIDAGNSPFKGPAEAKVSIIEFSDFECPYCSKGKQILEEVLAAYPKDVKVYFKNLPLPFHKEAAPAARAAYAAHKQGKFWEMHDSLFANQRNLGADFYLEQAKSLGLDIEKFKSDMASEEASKVIKEDEELARKHGIQGTPAFFVNGVLVRGAFPLEHFKKIIDRHLGKVEAGKAKS